jgi:HD-GYP domain-containing protein (c-di-GMP phosphodiesterase class II)
MDIPTQARIFAVVDVFDALTSSRNYRKKSSAEEALRYLQEQANILFDPEIVEALTRLPYKEFIEGEKTIV